MNSEQKKQEIREYCRVLKLNAVAEHFEESIEGSADYVTYLHSLLSAQIRESDQKALQRRIQCAHFPCRKYLEDLELDCLPEALRGRLAELRTLEFINKGQNVILTGNPGTGKTHTAIGLGMKSVRQVYSLEYACPDPDAAMWKFKNPRNAGRKPVYSDAVTAQVKQLRKDGLNIRIFLHRAVSPGAVFSVSCTPVLPDLHIAVCPTFHSGSVA